MGKRGVKPVPFWDRVNKTDTCWLWTGGKRQGYGDYSVNRRGVPAHRVAYELCVGPIPSGLTLDHLCRNRACVNPAHLEPVTNTENVMRGMGPFAVNARKTHCKRGHEFTDGNTYWNRGRRHCKECKAYLQRRAYWRRAFPRPQREEERRR